MRLSEQTDKLVEALAKAQGELVNPGKGLVADIKSDKGRFQYKYADLAAVLNAVRPALSKNGIAIIQAPVIVQRSILLTTRLACGDQWIETDYPVASVENNHQQIGSALTYARRYSLLCMTGLMGENEDDDAASAPPAANRQPEIRANPEDRRDTDAEPAEIAQRQPAARKSPAQARKDGDFEFLRDSMRLQTTDEETQAWSKKHADMINKLPRNWFDEIKKLYREQRVELHAKELAAAEAAADRASLEELAGQGPDETVPYDAETGEILDQVLDDDDLPPGLRPTNDYAAASRGR